MGNLYVHEFRVTHWILVVSTEGISLKIAISSLHKITSNQADWQRIGLHECLPLPGMVVGDPVLYCELTIAIVASFLEKSTS